MQMESNISTIAAPPPAMNTNITPAEVDLPPPARLGDQESPQNHYHGNATQDVVLATAASSSGRNGPDSRPSSQCSGNQCSVSLDVNHGSQRQQELNDSNNDVPAKHGLAIVQSAVDPVTLSCEIAKSWAKTKIERFVRSKLLRQKVCPLGYPWKEDGCGEGGAHHRDNS